MNRNIVLFSTLLWCGALAAIEGVQTAPATPALPSLDNIGTFNQWLREDASVRDNGDRSLQGRVQYLQKLDKKCEEYQQALKIELQNLINVWLRLSIPKVIRSGEIGLRDRAIVHKVIAKKCEAIAKGLIRHDALVDLIDRKNIFTTGDLEREPIIVHDAMALTLKNYLRGGTQLGHLIEPEYGQGFMYGDYSALNDEIRRAYLRENPKLLGLIEYDWEKSIKEYVLKTFSYHVPPRHMAHVLDTMAVGQIRLLFNCAVMMRRAVCVQGHSLNEENKQKEIRAFEENRHYFRVFLLRLEQAGPIGALQLGLISCLRIAAEDLKAIKFDEASSQFIMPNECLRNLRLLLNQPQPQD